MSSLTSLDSSLFVSKSESAAKAQTSHQSTQGRYGNFTTRNFFDDKRIPKFGKKDIKATSLDVKRNTFFQNFEQVLFCWIIH